MQAQALEEGEEDIAPYDRSPSELVSTPYPSAAAHQLPVPNPKYRDVPGAQVLINPTIYLHFIYTVCIYQSFY